MASISSTSVSNSSNRLTGLATGLDIDSMVKTEMKAYQSKVDSATQQKDVVEIKQKLYRDILSDTRTFYNKYLDPLSKDSLIMSSAYTTVKFTSSDESLVSVTASADAVTDSYTITGKLATAAQTEFTGIIKADEKIVINGKEFTMKGTSETEIAKNLNDDLKTAGLDVKVKYTKFGGTVSADTTNDNNKNALIIQSTVLGEKSELKVNEDKFSGENARIVIKNSSGGVYTHIGDSNTVSLDGVTFKFNGTLPTTEDKAIAITGKTDVSDSKNKIVNFINDYNTLIEKLNKTVNTKHSRDYKPLTSDQKSAMSDKEIELWNTKVEEGQLYKDSDLTRITSALKEAMRTVMSGTGIRGLSLEAIGIKPVKDYTGNKNGTFSIDESTLTEALENDKSSVMKLFITEPPTALKDDDKKDSIKVEQYKKDYEKTGVFYKIKDELNKEVVRSDSILSKKVGIVGTSTFNNNTLTKSISDYETKISQMKTEMTRREQLLYSKYANLENIMNKYNSQQSYLSSYIGS